MFAVVFITWIREAVARCLWANLGRKHPPAIKRRRFLGDIIGVKGPVVEGIIGEVHFQSVNFIGVGRFVVAAAAFTTDAKLFARDIVALGPADVIFLMRRGQQGEENGQEKPG